MAKVCIICGSEAVVGTCNCCGETLCDAHVKEADVDLFCPQCFGQL